MQGGRAEFGTSSFPIIIAAASFPQQFGLSKARRGGGVPHWSLSAPRFGGGVATGVRAAGGAKRPRRVRLGPQLRPRRRRPTAAAMASLCGSQAAFAGALNVTGVGADLAAKLCALETAHSAAVGVIADLSTSINTTFILFSAYLGERTGPEGAGEALSKSRIGKK